MDRVNLSSQSIGQLSPQQELISERAQFMSSVDQWEKAAPEGEDRRQIANDIRDVYDRNATEVKFDSVFITDLPPIPPLVTNLEIRHCAGLAGLRSLPQLVKLCIVCCNDFLTLVGDNLSQLTELDIGGCPKLTTLGNADLFLSKFI